MLLSIAVAAFTAATMAAHTDTTLAVRPGAKLDLNNFGGSVTITTWGKNAIHLEADHPRRVSVDVDASESTVNVRSSGRMGPPGAVEYQIEVPKWLPVRVAGVYTDISIEGVESEVRAETVKGDVTVHGGRGFISLESVQGDVELEGARGKIEVHAVNQDVRISGCEGEITAETVNGGIEFSDVRSAAVDAETVNGDVTYSGTILKDGRYHFATHNGDVSVGLPSSPSVNVSVATFSGDFESSFPLVLKSGKQSRRFSFTLGSGSAELELESFQGTIRLHHAGEAHAKKED